MNKTARFLSVAAVAAFAAFGVVGKSDPPPNPRLGGGLWQGAVRDRMT